MQILLIVLRGARLHTKAIVSIVINTAPALRFIIYSKRNSIMKDSAVNIMRYRIKLPFRPQGKVFYMKNKEAKEIY